MCVGLIEISEICMLTIFQIRKYVTLLSLDLYEHFKTNKSQALHSIFVHQS